MYRLVYLSAARGAADAAMVGDILATARRNNPPLDVTGLLMVHDHSFFQVLEGPRESVERLFSRISADPRHGSVIVMLRGETSERCFADWAMALARPSDLGAGTGEAVRDLVALGGALGQAADGDARVVRLIGSFLRTFGDPRLTDALHRGMDQAADASGR